MKSKLEFIKEYNTSKVIQLVREKGPISRVDISEQLNIPQPTLTRITEKLLTTEILREGGLGHSNGGRRPVLLTFNENCFYTWGIELGRSSVKVALINLNGNLLSFRVKETNPNDSILNIVEHVKNEVLYILEESGIDESLVLGVGVGLPGPLNETEDDLISPPNFYGEKDIPLRKLLLEALNYPVIFDNDASVAALAEKWFGKGMGLSNFAYVMADVGIGSGLVVGGNLYRGINGEAGEIGHSTIDLYGEKCTCGNYGCLETFTSIPKIEDIVRKKLKLAEQVDINYFNRDIESVFFEDIVNASRQGSHLARQTLEEAGRFLGVGIANLINFFAPEMVIIGGRIVEADSIILDTVRSSAHSHILGSGGKTINIVSSDLKEGVVLGAAALVIDDTFSLFSIK